MRLIAFLSNSRYSSGKLQQTDVVWVCAQYALVPKYIGKNKYPLYGISLPKTTSPPIVVHPGS